jgi:hypothetical protein
MSKYAVLCGNSQFPDSGDKIKLPDLACPEQDVDGLDRVLASERGEFDVLALKNKTSYKVIHELHRTVNKAQKDDLLLFYYSGHGVPKSGKLYLTSLDTVFAELEATAIPINRIYDILGTGKCKKIVIILDCCFSGVAGQGYKGDMDAQLQQLNNGRGTYLVTASTGVQLAHENAEEGLSLFTKHLITGLETGDADKGGDGLVDMDELYDYVHSKVKTENPEQEPTQYITDKRGDLIIAKSGRDSKTEQLRKIKNHFYDLAKDDRISGDILNGVLELLKRSQSEISLFEQQQYVLIIDLFENKIMAIEFVRKWDKLVSEIEQEKATEQRLARDKEVQDKAAKEQAEQEKATQQRLARDKVAQDKAAKEQAEQEKATEQTEQEKATQQLLARDKEAQDKEAKKQAEQEKATLAKTTQERLGQKTQEKATQGYSLKFSWLPPKFLAIIVALCLFGYFIERKAINNLSIENLKVWTMFESKPALTSMQTNAILFWYDLIWSNDVVNVNDTVTIKGKIYVFEGWPETLMKPDNALLNAGVTEIDTEDPVFIVEKVYIGTQLVSSPVRLEIGETYEFKILLKARRPGDWRLHALMTIKNSEQINSPEKTITIKGLINDFNGSVTPPLQTDVVENVKPIEMPLSTVSVKVEDDEYRIPARALHMTLTITNKGNYAVRLGELNIGGVRFLDADVVEDKTGYPDDLLAEDGLAVSDNSPLAPGQTRTIEVTASGAAWETYHLADSIYNPVYNPIRRLAGLLFFLDETGNRQTVIVNAPLIPSEN